jgi:hypothetical protein
MSQSTRSSCTAPAIPALPDRLGYSVSHVTVWGRCVAGGRLSRRLRWSLVALCVGEIALPATADGHGIFGRADLGRGAAGVEAALELVAVEVVSDEHEARAAL